MKVQNIDNIDKFFETVNSCKGKVEMLTNEGDRLNLKSQLTKYVALAKLFSDGVIPEVELVVYEKEDIEKLLEFMISK